MRFWSLQFASSPPPPRHSRQRRLLVTGHLYTYFTKTTYLDDRRDEESITDVTHAKSLLFVSLSSVQSIFTNQQFDTSFQAVVLFLIQGDKASRRIIDYDLPTYYCPYYVMWSTTPPPHPYAKPTNWFLLFVSEGHATHHPGVPLSLSLPPLFTFEIVLRDRNNSPNSYSSWLLDQQCNNTWQIARV